MNLRVLLLPWLILPLACDSKEAPASSDAAPAAKDAAKPVDTTKQAEAKKAKDAIATAPPAMQAKLATAAIVEIDKTAIPASLVEGLEAITQAPADMRAAMLAKSISENMGLVREVCGPDAATLLQSMATMDLSGRDAAMWNGCDMERHGLISKSDRAGFDPLLALVAHMVFLHVAKDRTLSPDERSLLKAMMLRGETTP